MMNNCFEGPVWLKTTVAVILAIDYLLSKLTIIKSNNLVDLLIIAPIARLFKPKEKTDDEIRRTSDHK